MRHEILLTEMSSETMSGLGIQGRRKRTKNMDMSLTPKPDAEYWVIGENDRSLGLWVNVVGWQKMQPDMTYPSKEYPEDYFFSVKKGRMLDEYLLVYITDGTGKFYTKKSEWGGVKVNGGYLLWLTPGQWHSYTPNIQTGWTEHYIGFGGELVEKMIRHSFLEDKNGAFDIGFNEELASLFIRASEVARLQKAGYQSYLSGMVLHMLGLVMSRLKERMGRSCKNEQTVELAKIIMKENLSTNLNMSELADSLGFSYSYFRKLFKDYTGIGPARYFLELKIDKVKQLLVNTEMSVKEILYILGYNTTENFHGAFKKYTGYTPIEYRRVMLEEKGDRIK